MAKHLFYLINNQLTATVWNKGVLSAAQTFDNYPSGRARFAEYLATNIDAPAYLLTDLVEEDFQREELPHVIGTAKKHLLQRRLTALYRETPFSTASYQGREKTGRKDDHVLCSALTNAQLLNPWLEKLQETKIDLAGIYSVALLSVLFFKKLNLGREPTLLVTHQSSGLRQNFFEDGYLRFSRLSPETAWSPESIAEMTVTEIAKTRQFLASTRLLARGAPLNIVVVAAEEIIEFLNIQIQDEAGLQYNFISLSKASQLFGFDNLIDLTLCDPLFLSLLGKQQIKNQYAPATLTRSHLFTQVRDGLNHLSIVIISIAVLGAANNGFDTYQSMKLTRLAQIETQSALAQYQVTLKNMPVTMANSNEMKLAVNLEQMITDNAPKPERILSLVSQALDGLPQVKILTIHWEASDTEEQIAAPTMPPATLPNGETAPVSISLIGIPNKPIEILTIECEIVPFRNDYRKAVEAVNQLMLQLQKDTHIQVTLTKPVLDIRPTGKLESNAGDDLSLARPQFNLRVIWKP